MLRTGILAVVWRATAAFQPSTGSHVERPRKKNLLAAQRGSGGSRSSTFVEQMQRTDRFKTFVLDRVTEISQNV
jgi:hypothetical protein